MQNKPYFFFGNRGSQKGGRGGSDTWEKFPKNPVFFWVASLRMASLRWVGGLPEAKFHSLAHFYFFLNEFDVKTLMLFFF